MKNRPIFSLALTALSMFDSPERFTDEVGKHHKNSFFTSKTVCKFDFFHFDQLIAQILLDASITLRSLITFLESEIIFFFEPIGSISHHNSSSVDISLKDILFSEMNVFSIVDDQKILCIFREVVIQPHKKFKSPGQPIESQASLFPEKNGANKSKHKREIRECPRDLSEDDLLLPCHALYKIVYKKIPCQLCQENFVVKFISNMLFMGKVCKYCYQFLKEIEWSESYV